MYPTQFVGHPLLAMYAAQWVPPIEVKPKYGPPEPSKCARYCLACDCSTYGFVMDPCWYCGGITQAKRPAYWQDWKSPQAVRNGDSWSPDEETMEEAA